MRFLLSFIIGATTSFTIHNLFLNSVVNNPTHVAKNAYILGCKENSNKSLSKCRQSATLYWLEISLMFGDL